MAALYGFGVGLQGVAQGGFGLDDDGFERYRALRSGGFRSRKLSIHHPERAGMRGRMFN